MNIPFVDLNAQYHALKPEMDAAIQSVLERTAFILGPEVEAFEQAFADYIGAKHAIGVGSGTDALRLALEALDIGPGDEVITVANTYIATCEAISHVGATVRLVDADPRTYNMDVEKLEAEIGNRKLALSLAEGSEIGRLKAIIPVHLYGQPTDMPAIMKLARKHGLKVIEDCAQAHGAKIVNPKSEIRNPKSQMVGTFGDVACFSFYPSKNLGAYGDGGAVLTDDDEVAERVRLLRNHGQKAKYEHLVVGYCHRLDNLQAAVLNVKLPHLDEWNAARRAHAALYNQLLSNVPGVVTPYVAANVEHVYHLYVIQVPDRDEVQATLKAAGVETGIHYPIPLHEQPAYAHLGYKPEDFPVTYALAPWILSLPMYPELKEEQIHYVAEVIRRTVEGT